MSNKELATALEPEVPQEEIQAAEAEQQPTEPAQEPEQQPEKDKVVPHGAFHEERERRKALQRELEEYRRKDAAEKAVLQDRLNQHFRATQAQQNPAPDPAQDPLGAMAHGQQVTAQQLAQIQQRMAQEDAQKAEAQRIQNIVSWAQGQASEYVKEVPDFPEAYKHLVSTRAAELQAMGLPPQHVAMKLAEDELWVYTHAAQTGKNPAQVAYEMAKAAGYKPGGRPSATQKVEALQKGMEAAKKLGNGAVDGVPTPEEIANMSEEQFAELKSKLKKKGMSISDVL